mmetsp:Transcript_87280/g.151882  ORF Transcript_87280/g.151882 Transcript_87280/m.151882 type:complete len:89 (-) Transcript_87280:251-517(-)
MNGQGGSFSSLSSLSCVPGTWGGGWGADAADLQWSIHVYEKHIGARGRPFVCGVAVSSECTCASLFGATQLCGSPKWGLIGIHMVTPV